MKCLKIFLIISLSFFLADAFANNIQPVESTTSDNQELNNNYTVMLEDVKTKAAQVEENAVSVMSSITPDKESVLEKRIEKENLIASNPFGITFYKPTYILPFYYTSSPYHKIYENNTPDHQQLQEAEFKGQISLKAPIWHNVIGQYSALNIAFSQVVYWQFYAKSQYFREINCEAEAFLSKRIIPHWWFNLGAVHQSNGRGGELERSWNRAYIDLAISGERWLISLRPWVLIFKDESINLHNPDITHYLGNGRILLAYQFKNGHTFSLNLRNAIGSLLKRYALECGYSFPIHGHVNGYIQFFDGYGQSLIEYDHRTSSIGIGIAFSDWI